MKAYTMICFGLIAALLSIQAHADNYTLKRSVITWSDQAIDDSAIGSIQVSGNMSVVGNTITQNISFCRDGACESLNTRGEILEVAVNTANVTIKDNTGFTDKMTILSLYPNIITMIHFTDGTVWVDEWEPDL